MLIFGNALKDIYFGCFLNAAFFYYRERGLAKTNYKGVQIAMDW